MKYLPWIIAAVVIVMLWLGQEYRKTRAIEQAYAAAQQFNQHQQQLAQDMQRRQDEMDYGPYYQSEEQRVKPLANAQEKQDSQNNQPESVMEALKSGAGQQPKATAADISRNLQARDQLCYSASSTAARMMRKQQQGASLAELSDIADNSDADIRQMLQPFVNRAYKSPRYGDINLQEGAVGQFKNLVYQHCMQGA